jgi:hypothetical protein
MQNNIFSVRETFWLQAKGTAMGTPTACAYTTLTYGHHENKVILPNFQENLLYYRHYIDNIIGIWSPHGNNDTSVWENFKTQ